MKARRKRIAGVVADQTLKNGVSKRLGRELAAYLISEHRTNDLESVLRDVQKDWAAAGHVEVIATSAHPLTAEIRQDIESHIKQLYPDARSIVINEQQDPEIIGGIRLNLPDRQLDLSIEAKLNKFKQLTLAGKD